MDLITAPQGSSEWRAIRQNYDTASEAAAALGKHKYMTRTALLEQKRTGISREIDSATQSLFNSGHAAEAAARPHAEAIVGSELFPITGSREIEGLKLLASFDGMTMDGEIIFEHKLYSASLAAQVESGVLEPHYTIQMDQQLLVSGASKCLFMTSDGTKEKMAWMWYESNIAKFTALIAGWQQFKNDLAAYAPAEVIEPPKAAPVSDLPAVTVQVRGELTLCNLSDVTPHFDRFLAGAVTELKTDDDFALAEAQAKKGREVAKRCELTAKAVVDQMASVAEVTRQLEDYAAKFNALALKQEKAVTQQKEARKAAAKLERDQAYADHIASLNDEIAPLRLVLADADKPNFVEAMKNQRTLASLYNKLDTELARVKIAADATAAQIRAKLNWFNANASEHKFLFSDLQSLINRGDLEFFQLATKNRIADHEAAEQKRLEAERARIQAEEEAKAAAKVRAEQETAALAQRAAEAYQRAAVAQPVAIPSEQATLQAVASAAPVTTDATIKLGQINDLLGGLKVDAEFLERKGFHARQQQNAKLYRVADLPAIYTAIIHHVQAVAAAPYQAAA